MRKLSSWQQMCFRLSEEKISFNVLEEPKKGLFGKIKGEAKVEAEYSETKTDIAVKYIKRRA